MDLALTVNFKSVNFTCTCTIIFKFNEPSSYMHAARLLQLLVAMDNIAILSMS